MNEKQIRDEIARRDELDPATENILRAIVIGVIVIAIVMVIAGALQ